MNPKEKQRQARNFLAKCIAVIGIFVGVVFLLRGWGLGQQSTTQFVENQDVASKELLPINTILSIAGVSVPPSGGPESTWASDISNSTGLPATNGFWIVEKKSNATVIGQFTTEKFIPYAVFPERLLKEKLFHNGKLWGLTAPGSNSQLLLGFLPSNTNQLVKLYEFSRDRVVLDIQLAAKDKEIYFAWGEESSVARNISVIRPTGELLPVYSSNHYQILDILAAYPENNFIYFKAFSPSNSQQALCYKLNLQNNNVSDIQCAAVPLDGHSVGFGIVENSTTKGTDIYRYIRDGISNPDFVFNSNAGQTRSLITRKGDRLMWIETTPNGNVSIPVYNVNNLQLIKRLEVLPGAKILQLWVIGDKVVALGEVKDAEIRIFVESNESTSSSASAMSTESVSSSATSAPNLGFEVEQQLGWKMYTLEGCAQNCDISILEY